MPEDVFEVLRRHPPGSATLSGPAPFVNPTPVQQKPSPEPSIGKVAAYTVLPAAGAMLAPEAVAAGVAGAVARSAGFAPELIQAGVQLLTRGAGAGMGALGAGELTSPRGETAEAATQRRLGDLATGGLGEGLGAGLSVGARAAGRVVPALGRLQARMRPREPLEAGARDVVPGLARYGGRLLPGQMTTSPGIDTIENILNAGFGSQGTMGRAHQSGIDAATQWIDDAFPKVAAVSTPKQAGDLIETLVTKPLEAQKVIVRSAYANLDREITSSGLAPSVDLVPALTSFESKFATRIAKGDPAAVRIQHYLDSGGQPLSFKEAEEIRGLLLDLYRSADPQVAPGIRAYAGKVAADVDKAIEQAATNSGALGQNIRIAADAARAARKTQAEFFNEELIGPLLEKAAPERVADIFLADNNPTQIEALRRIVYEPKFRNAIGGDPDAYWAQIQGAYATSRRVRMGDTAYGSLDGRALGEAIDQSKGTFEALYPDKAQQENIRRSVRALEMIQARPGGSRSGSVLIQMTQGRSVGTALASLGDIVSIGGAGYYAAKGDATKSAIIFMAPAIFAKAWASKNFSRWIFQRAVSRDTRLSSNLGSVVAQGIDALIRDRVPFGVYDPTSGSVTIHDPKQGTSGPLAGTKPVSKLKPPGP